MKNELSSLPSLSARFRSHGIFPWGTALLMIIVGLLGCLAIYSSRAYTGTPMQFVVRQLVWLLPGILIFLVASVIPFSFYRKLALPWFIFNLLLLTAVLFLGKSVNGMHGWFDLKFVHVQPSEFAKSSFLLYLCIYCGSRKTLGWKDYLCLFGCWLLTAGLILAEPDFGSALMFFIIFILVIILRGIKLHFLIISAGAMMLAAVTFLTSNEYALKRVIGYLEPESSLSSHAWHIRQFQYTMAHGGWFGADWGSALWSGAFLPLPHTDSLFASIVESTGFIGGLIVISGFLGMAIVFCILSWKMRGSNDDRRLFIFTVGAAILIQALIHISVNCVLIPPTGVPLPILSYGGSSLFSLLLLFGIASSAFHSPDTENETK